jgi:hypothetical protein
MGRWNALLICAALVIIFCAQSWLAVRQKSATMDEPRQSAGAFLHVFHRDYRVNPEDPPLWHYWMMLGVDRHALRIDRGDALWEQMLEDTRYQAAYTTRLLYQTPANDGIGFVQACRFRMLLIAAMLGTVVGLFAWKLGGAVAAIGATFLYSFDPNFLAHASLVKNDVAISLCMLAMVTAVWSVGRGATWWNIALPGLMLGAALTVKFSGILCAAMLAVLLLSRALLDVEWPILGRAASRRISKLLVAFSLILVSGVLAWAIIWASYGFRFDPTPIAGVSLPLHTQVREAARHQYLLAHNFREPSEFELNNWPASLPVRAMLFADQYRLLPQPFLYGVLFQYQTTMIHGSYLMGQTGSTGWWYYFPVAVLTKTPLATIAAAILATTILIGSRRLLASGRSSANIAPVLDAPDLRHAANRGERSQIVSGRWTLFCFAAPVVIYALSALTSNFNLGLRHLLPLYPFLYIAIGVAAAKARLFLPRAASLASTLVGLGLLVESVTAFPNYLPFFNAIARPHRLYLLGGSNLDWGQDLPALAHWVKQHPDERLYLAYFGMADPAAYGIKDYIHIPGGFWLGPPVELPDPSRPGVLALSASVLQGSDLPPPIQQLYVPYRHRPPREILGGSIYLFDFP